MVAESKVESKPEQKEKTEIEEDEQEVASSDWLSGHLDLLNKIGDK
jgi:hypothetical protein